MNEFLFAIHLAVPITGILFLAVRKEKNKIIEERRKLAQTLLIATRGRRRF